MQFNLNANQFFILIIFAYTRTYIHTKLKHAFTYIFKVFILEFHLKVWYIVNLLSVKCNLSLSLPSIRNITKSLKNYIEESKLFVFVMVHVLVSICNNVLI